MRNLTPFPVRDAFASALSQPAEQSQFSTHGHLSDDLDVTLSRKRSRRVSANSVATLRSGKSEESVNDESHPSGAAAELRGRRRTTPRASFSAGGSARASSTARPYSSSGSAPTIRPHRVRTASMTSSVNSNFASSSLSGPSLNLSSGVAPFTAVLTDNSQTALERIIKSRLVETFFAITIPLQEPQVGSLTSPSTASPVPASPLSPKFRAAKAASQQPSKSAFGRPTTPRSTASNSPGNTKQVSLSSLRSDGKVQTPHAAASSPSSPVIQPDFASSSTLPLSHVPDYLSTVHQPSTNPAFAIDPRSEFPGRTDLSGQKLNIEVWAKVGIGQETVSNLDVKAKGKERGVSDDTEWRLLDEWHVDLSQLIPVPEDVSILLWKCSSQIYILYSIVIDAPF